VALDFSLSEFCFTFDHCQVQSPTLCSVHRPGICACTCHLQERVPVSLSGLGLHFVPRLAIPIDLSRSYSSHNAWYVQRFRCETYKLTEGTEPSASASVSNSLSQRNPAWSKEALFGLLGVLVVIVVPFVGFLIRFCSACRLSSKSSKETGTRAWVSYLDTLKLTGLAFNEDIELCDHTARRRERRRWRKTSSRSRTKTIVLVL
jgi:hypothetical protein